jgi:hypothetical protein
MAAIIIPLDEAAREWLRIRFARKNKSKRMGVNATEPGGRLCEGKGRVRVGAGGVEGFMG